MLAIHYITDCGKARFIVPIANDTFKHICIGASNPVLHHRRTMDGLSQVFPNMWRPGKRISHVGQWTVSHMFLVVSSPGYSPDNRNKQQTISANHGTTIGWSEIMQTACLPIVWGHTGFRGQLLVCCHVEIYTRAGLVDDWSNTGSSHRTVKGLLRIPRFIFKVSFCYLTYRYMWYLCYLLVIVQRECTHIITFIYLPRIHHAQNDQSLFSLVLQYRTYIVTMVYYHG